MANKVNNRAIENLPFKESMRARKDWDRWYSRKGDCLWHEVAILRDGYDSFDDFYHKAAPICRKLYSSPLLQLQKQWEYKTDPHEKKWHNSKSKKYLIEENGYWYYLPESSIVAKENKYWMSKIGRKYFWLRNKEYYVLEGFDKTKASEYREYMGQLIDLEKAIKIDEKGTLRRFLTRMKWERFDREAKADKKKKKQKLAEASEILGIAMEKFQKRTAEEKAKQAEEAKKQEAFNLEIAKRHGFDETSFRSFQMRK